MRIGLIGYGSAGRRHARNIRQLRPDAQVYVLDPNVTVEDGTPGIVSVDAESFWQAGATSLEALVIASPMETHLKHLGYADELRLPVLCEKPVCWPGQIESAAAIINRLLGMTGYNWLWHPGVQRMQRACRAPRFIRVVARTNMAEWPGAAYGPPLWECSHELSVLRSWLGELEVTAAGRRSARAGGVACGRAQGCAWEFQWRTREAEGHGRTWEVQDDDTREPGSFKRFGFPPYGSELDDSYRLMMADFLWLAKGVDVMENCSLADGLAVARLCQEIDRIAEPANAVILGAKCDVP